MKPNASGWLAALTLAALTPCSCGGETNAGGRDASSEATPGDTEVAGDAPADATVVPTADAYVNATVAPGAGGMCNMQSSTVIVDIGEVVDPNNKPVRIANGGMEPGGQLVTVTCSVTASGSGFNVQLSAEQLGPGGGSFSVTSPVGQPLDPVIGGTVSASWTNIDVGLYDESDCQLTYAYQGGPVPFYAGAPIAPGRIWAHVSCPMATDNQQMPAPVCDGEADFIFENCEGS